MTVRSNHRAVMMLNQESSTDLMFEKITSTNSSITNYLNSLQSYPQLTHEQLVNLFQKYEKGGKESIVARKKLAESNLRLVVYVAKKQKSHNIPLEDLIQEGNLGLLKAIERFDWKKGFRFSTYATWWIKQAISQYVLKRKKIIRLPAHAASAQRKMIEAMNNYKDEMGSEPTSAELSSMIEVSESVVKATIHSGKNVISLNQPILSDSEDATLEDKLEDLNENLNPFEVLAKKELMNVVKNVLSNLSAKEAAILRLRFGLSEDIEETLYTVTDAEKLDIISGKGLS
jgi:RNA polymerase primary sigma factor